MEQCQKCKDENRDCSNTNCYNCPNQQSEKTANDQGNNNDKQYLTKGDFDGIL